MGTSKIVMLSGVYVILGFYTISFNRADETNFSNALNATSTAQAEQLAQTGVSLALAYMADNASLYSFSTRSLSTMGGTVAYASSRPASFSATQSEVRATGTFNGKQVVMTAVFHYYGGRWKVLRVYTETV
ncbi:MAG: hypothetical protein HYV29_09815 [Ignavibacteriales bacterium]|nr:hypothetical protein [Ignavibacteriales bacterium]